MVQTMHQNIFSPRYFYTFLWVFVCVFIIVYPVHASSTDDLTVSGWIPYWRDSEGIKDAKKHLSDIDTVYPFAFSVQSDGSIKDLADLKSREWKTFVTSAAKKDVEIIPTLMWGDGVSTHAVLSNAKTRALHIEVIKHMVEDGNYDGVDIDYEGKKAETIDYFSKFLIELKEALGDKVLSCTIEARTPPESLYREIPREIKYANDYEVIGEVCDRVVIMAYDQQRADLLLNATKNGTPYMPVSDVDWVRKVVEFALEDIPQEKLIIGIPTYGHHYTVTVAPDWYKSYTRIGALNVPDMLEVAHDYKVTPTRNKAGEMSFSYLPKDSPVTLSSSLKIPKNTPKGNIVAARALAYANKTGKEVQFRIGWYSDATAMKQKIDLAREYDLRGVSLFKIDGEEDQKVWKYLP
jgi:spore germination protein YaaH